MVAWAGADAGHWVVRTAPVLMSGVGVVGTIAAPGADLLLDCLAAGPDADALVLWTQPQPSASAPASANASRSSPRRASMPRMSGPRSARRDWWRRPRRCMG